MSHHLQRLTQLWVEPGPPSLTQHAGRQKLTEAGQLTGLAAALQRDTVMLLAFATAVKEECLPPLCFL